MTAISWWLVQNTITAAVLTAIVLAACRLLRDRPALQHALWLVVLIKFLTPPVVCWPWSAQEIAGPILHSTAHERNISPAESMLIAASPAIPDQERFHGARRDEARAEEIAAPAAAPPPTPVSGESRITREIPARLDGAAANLVPASVAGVWLAGCIIALAIQVRRIRLYSRFVRRGKCASQPLADEIDRLARKLGVRPVPALVTPGITAPFIWCLGRLRLIWPERLSPGSELGRSRGVLAHELAHVRRRDHWVAWAELMAGVIWWWNPLFWFVRRRLRESAEMACDALAISVLPDEPTGTAI